MSLGSHHMMRRFPVDTEEYLLKWHEDEEDRIIHAMNENDWKFQFDNELPIDLSVGQEIYIPKGITHRVIKGTTELLIHIHKIN